MGNNPSRELSAKKIALLPMAKRDLKLSDESYRAILMLHGCVARSRDLDLIGFDHVMRYLTALGFRSTWTKRLGNRVGMASPAQVELIRSLWRAYAPDDKDGHGLNGWLERFHKVSSLRFVDDVKAKKVIAALKAMAKRAR